MVTFLVALGAARVRPAIKKTKALGKIGGAARI